MKKTLLVIALIVSTGIVYADVSQAEKDALTDLYVTTDGENWINTWDLNTPVNTWHGVTVKGNSVVAISLLFNNLQGVLPNSLEDLKNLEKLELSFNKLSGKIPASIGSLQKLKIFSINGNNFTGTIPATFGSLQNIKELHLSSNKLEGTIPTSIGKLDTLEVLNLFDNNLGGTVPYALAESKNLKKLVIAENYITTTEAFAGVLLFEGDDDTFKNPDMLIPAKTVIANETNDDDN